MFFDELSALGADPVHGGFGEGEPVFVVGVAVCVEFYVLICAYSCDGDVCLVQALFLADVVPVAPGCPPALRGWTG